MKITLKQVESQVGKLSKLIKEAEQNNGLPYSFKKIHACNPYGFCCNKPKFLLIEGKQPEQFIEKSKVNWLTNAKNQLENLLSYYNFLLSNPIT